MGSGGGGGGNAGMMALMNQGRPMPGLPIAGQGGGIGNAYEYGKFQNFLPDVKAEGPNDMATGLRPEMFEYRSPSGVVQQSNSDTQIAELRNSLAALQAAQAAQQNQFGAGQGGMLPWVDPFGGINGNNRVENMGGG